MPEIPWNSAASLARVTSFETADPHETAVAHGTFRELVDQVLAMNPDEQRGLLLRAAGADWVTEFDTDAIRELAARPEFTGVYGVYDSARDDEDDALDEVGDEEILLEQGMSGPSRTDAHGQDGER